MAGVSSKLMWSGFALFTFGLVFGQLIGGSWFATVVVFVGVVLYLIGAFELTEQVHDVESKSFVNTSTDILLAHVDENDKLMLTGLGIFLLGAGMVATGSLPVAYGFIASLGGLLMYSAGAFSFNADLEMLRRRAER
jgi:hypothetical protein